MAVEFEAPVMQPPHRIILLGAMTSAWYEATDDARRTRILPRFSGLMEEWRALGVRILGTLDDDLFMVGEPRVGGVTFYLMCEVDRMETIVAMLERIRETVDGVRLDAYMRFEARVGRPFFLLE